jgi:glucose-6-phosphate 1-epimerase
MGNAAMNEALMQQLRGSGVIVLENAAGDTATISLFGAQVLSWHSARRGEQLYCSTLATTDQGQAIRGGIPVCFPQFSGFGDLPKHGIVRTEIWEIAQAPISGKTVTQASVRLKLRDNVRTRAHWHYRFDVQLDVQLAQDQLTVQLHVENTGTEAFAFSAALHTYLAQADVRNARVTHLAGQSYVDTTTTPHTAKVQKNEALTVPDEVDYIYYAAPKQLTLHDQHAAQLQLTMTGFNDTVIWNPGPQKCRALSDMPDDDWLKMLCIEAVQFEVPVTLAPGSIWQGAQQLQIIA